MNLNSVQLNIEQNKAIITFYSSKGNSFTSYMLHELSELLHKVSEDDTLNVIILKSKGEKTFCAGASFDELLQIGNQENATMFFSGFAKVILAMKNCKIPVITRVQGNAVGGGVGIIAASDYAIAINSCKVKLSELSLGFGPFVIEPAVSRKIGSVAMQNISYNPEDWKDSTWALENNLFQEIVETEKLLDEAIDKFVNQLSSYNRNALIELKKIFWNNTQHWDKLLYERAATSGKLALSTYTKDKLKEFIK